MSRVLIAIQARSGSTRLPRKAFEAIGDKRMLDHVIDSCKTAKRYLLRHPEKPITAIDIVVVTPERDPIAEAFRGHCPVLEGPSSDVLGRYQLAAERFNPDYVVRITGDCPLIPDYIISKHVVIAVMNKYDYVSNVDEGSRTAVDGHDCEVMSTALLKWLADNATLDSDREHVTPMARRAPPDWAKHGAIIHYDDRSALKLSVDTMEDLTRVRAAYDTRNTKILFAQDKFGKQAVHRI